MKSLQKLNDTEKELRYIIKYIKVSVFTSISDTVSFGVLTPTDSWEIPVHSQHSTEAAVEESERIFSRLIRSIEKQSCEVKELIRVQERAAVSQAEELLEKVQRETAELKRSEEELEKLCHTEDHLHFLQVWNQIWHQISSISLPEVEVFYVVSGVLNVEPAGTTVIHVNSSWRKQWKTNSEHVLFV